MLNDTLSCYLEKMYKARGVLLQIHSGHECITFTHLSLKKRKLFIFTILNDQCWGKTNQFSSF